MTQEQVKTLTPREARVQQRLSDLEEWQQAVAEELRELREFKRIIMDWANSASGARPTGDWVPPPRFFVVPHTVPPDGGSHRDHSLLGGAREAQVPS